ncbi:MAG: SPASM domain-containing protein [Elusimicrobia bacterium]|nr:SPASM domain-containing protein [Elusimicrobiota bacterium]
MNVLSVRPTPRLAPAPPAIAQRFKRVYIEISNVCNLQCSFCPAVARDTQFMGIDLFRKIAAAAAPLTEEVGFHLMGEPLLHPAFNSFVDACASLGLPIHLTTNGFLLQPTRSNILLHPALKQINFSLQSFADNFPEKDDADYLQRIFDFTERAGRERPDLYINYRLWNHGAPRSLEGNGRLIGKIKRGLGVDFGNVPDVRWKKSVPLKGRASLHFDTRFQWPHPDQPVRSSRGFCHGLSTHIGVLADGTVVPCCLDKEGVINLGNLGTQNIHDVLQSPRATAIREGFKKGILVEDLCRKCTYISRFDGKAQKINPDASPRPPDPVHGN